MIPLTLAQIAEAVGGRLTGADPGALVTGSVEFDSREIGPGALFVALDGERVDGHEFAAAAMERGAVGVLATRPVDAPAVLVDDCLVALAKLARHVVDRLPKLTVVGITGSSGKTSTKDLVAQLLRRLGDTVAPPGSFNNELGHPYTVLRSTEDTRFLVLEKSARGVGHVRWLTEVAPPRIGVVLNVGTAHVGEFGSIETTALAKGELVEALPGAADGGVAVLNADDARVAAMTARTSARVVLVGRAENADVRAEDVSLDDAGRASFTLRTAGGAVAVRLALHGEHHVGNALAAAAVALELGMGLDDVAAALGEARPLSRWRMEVTERPDGVTVVNDAYNANPDSMRAAIRALSSMSRGRRSWAVLGYMAELGERAETEHAGVGEFVAATGIDRLVVIGEGAAPMHKAAARAAVDGSWRGESVHVPDVEAALAVLADGLAGAGPDGAPGDVVLVKASKSAHLEGVALTLLGGKALA